MLSGLLYQGTIPDSALGWLSPGWARRRPDQREAEEGDPGEGGHDTEEEKERKKEDEGRDIQERRVISGHRQ